MYYTVNAVNVDISKALQGVARANGWKVSDYIQEMLWLVLLPASRSVEANSEQHAGWAVITIDQAIKMLQQRATLKISNHELTFNKDGSVKVGNLTTVDFSTIAKIYKKEFNTHPHCGKIKVLCPHVEIAQAIQKLAFKADYKWASGENKINPDCTERIFIDTKIHSLFTGGASPFEQYTDYETFTIEQVIDMLQKESQCMKIATHLVQVAANGDGIFVGCQHIPQTTLDEIYQRAVDAQR